MNRQELTYRGSAAKVRAMQGTPITMRKLGWGRTVAVALVLGGATLTGGCVSVNAPDKPIVIELNINIKQEVVYSLAADAAKTIDDNPDVF